MSGHHRAGSPEERPAGIPPDEPPAYVVEQAKRAYTGPARELAELTFDSLVDGDSGPDDHRLRFEHPDLSVTLDVSARPEGTGMRGRVDPAAPRVALYMRATDLAMVAEADEGRFEFGLVPHGLVRLSIERVEPAPAVWTDWFRV